MPAVAGSQGAPGAGGTPCRAIDERRIRHDTGPGKTGRPRLPLAAPAALATTAGPAGLHRPNRRQRLTGSAADRPTLPPVRSGFAPGPRGISRGLEGEGAANGGPVD